MPETSPYDADLVAQERVVRRERWNWWVIVGLATCVAGFVLYVCIMQPPSWWRARLADGSITIAGLTGALIAVAYALHGYGIRIRLQHLRTIERAALLEQRGASPGAELLRETTCAGCGYDLRGSAAERCPECGREVGTVIDDDPEQRELEAHVEQHRRRYVLVRAVCAPVAVVAALVFAADLVDGLGGVAGIVRGTGQVCIVLTARFAALNAQRRLRHHATILRLRDVEQDLLDLDDDAPPRREGVWIR